MRQERKGSGEITRNKRQDKQEVSDQEGPTRFLDTQEAVGLGETSYSIVMRTVGATEQL